MTDLPQGSIRSPFSLDDLGTSNESEAMYRRQRLLPDISSRVSAAPPPSASIRSPFGSGNDDTRSMVRAFDMQRRMNNPSARMMTPAETERLRSNVVCPNSAIVTRQDIGFAIASAVIVIGLLYTQRPRYFRSDEHRSDDDLSVCEMNHRKTLTAAGVAASAVVLIPALVRLTRSTP